MCPSVCPKSIGAFPSFLVAFRIAKFKIQQFCRLHTGYDGMGKFWMHQWVITACMKETDRCLTSGNADCPVRCRIFCTAICCLGIRRAILLVEKQLSEFLKHGPEGGAVGKTTGNWRRLHTDELHDTYFSPDINLVTKSRIIGWVGNVARMAEKRNI